jgi:outer membrane lipoprotein SlyB
VRTWMLVGLLGVSGCASAPPPPPVAHTDNLVRGVIVSMRPIPVFPGAQSTILAAFGSPTTAAQTPSTEFIIRADNGATISVVQGNAEKFQPGERIGLAPGDRTRVIPLPN